MYLHMLQSQVAPYLAVGTVLTAKLGMFMRQHSPDYQSYIMGTHKFPYIVD